MAENAVFSARAGRVPMAREIAVIFLISLEMLQEMLFVVLVAFEIMLNVKLLDYFLLLRGFF